MTNLDLGTIKPLVEIVAAERTGSRPDLFEDAVQEGLIAAWLASEKTPDKPAVYYRVAAKNGVRNVVTGRSLTGHEGRRGWQDAQTKAEPLTKVSDDGEHEYAVEVEDVASAQALEAAENGAEVREALRSIEDVEAREDAFWRFWCGWTWDDIAKARGVRKNRLEWRWREHTRPRLREVLAPAG